MTRSRGNLVSSSSSSSHPIEHDVSSAIPSTPRQQSVLGIPLALTDYERTLDWIDAAAATRERGFICVAAVHTVMACHDDPELRAAVLGASFTVPDGQPLVWALNALGHRLPTACTDPP